MSLLSKSSIPPSSALLPLTSPPSSSILLPLDVELSSALLPLDMELSSTLLPRDSLFVRLRSSNLRPSSPWLLLCKFDQFDFGA